jgi:hypothetical protein
MHRGAHLKSQQCGREVEAGGFSIDPGQKYKTLFEK